LADLAIVLLRGPNDQDDDLSSFASVARLLKPAFDYIWLEFGYDRSHNFDDAGQWNPK